MEETVFYLRKPPILLPWPHFGFSYPCKSPRKIIECNHVSIFPWQILLYSFITDLFYTTMGCVHAQQLHFNPQIMRLNVKITRQNSMVCVMHEARPGNLIAIKKKHDSVKQNILFLQTCRNKLSFKQPRSLVKRNSI